MVSPTVQSQGSGVASTPAGPHSSCIPTLAIAGSSSAGALPGQEREAGEGCCLANHSFILALPPANALISPPQPTKISHPSPGQTEIQGNPVAVLQGADAVFQPLQALHGNNLTLHHQSPVMCATCALSPPGMATMVHSAPAPHLARGWSWVHGGNGAAPLHLLAASCLIPARSNVRR
ncbi:hypothetical protein Anapl_07860 [Anas platyrhynchos]|uniref:Uncharacterized protein n=1 Tax=Anas platyrhynchos TaxID=8839 RepID=R0KN01_ANAPL|nr:hypothetical protein Anapl_07860 [Anas platyrhynchos]